jgi:hypothetical protein
MRLAHPACLQLQLTLATSLNELDGYIVWLHAAARHSDVCCTDCVKMLPQLWLNEVKDWHRDLTAVVDAGCTGCMAYLFNAIETGKQWHFMRSAAAVVLRAKSLVALRELYAIAASSTVDAEFRQSGTIHKYNGYAATMRLWCVQEVLSSAIYDHMQAVKQQQPALKALAEFQRVADD